MQGEAGFRYVCQPSRPICSITGTVVTKTKQDRTLNFTFRSEANLSPKSSGSMRLGPTACLTVLHAPSLCTGRQHKSKVYHY